MNVVGDLKKIGNDYFRACFNWSIPVLIGLSFLISIILLPYWQKYNGIMHTGLEMVCIFMEFGSFVIFWLTYRINEFPTRNYLAFGFLCIAIIDVMHVLTFPPLGLCPPWNMDLSVKYSILGRIVEVIILILMASEAKNRLENRLVALLLTLTSTGAGVYIIYRFPNIVPKLYTSSYGITGIKIIIEYAIILFLILSFVKMRNKVKISSFISYNHVFTGLIFTISSQICYTLYSNLGSVYLLWGHILKIIFYCYLFKGLFITTLIYPYNKIINIYIESEERYKSAFDNLTIGVALTDLQGKINKVNKNLLDLLGYSEQELLGRTFGSIIPEGDAFIDETYAKKLLEINNDKIILFEGRYKHKNGQDVWVRVNISLTNNIMGKPVYFVHEVQDISTSKKVIELEIGMQKKVEQLSDALEFDKLRTEFFANLSHELRTPLNVITGALQLLEINLKDNTNEDILRNMVFIKQNSRRLIRLINNIIDTTKIEAGFFQLSLKNYNIISLVEDITLSIAGYTSLKGQELIFDTDVEERIIACDPDKIERIILNLLSNSIKFTGKDGYILVNICNKPDGVIISVKDNGIGIPKEKQGLIFERFRQVDKSFTRNAEGSGIGLSLVKSLVELHGGHISLNSELGKGSEFIIYLPSHIINNQEDEACSTNEFERVERVNVEFSDIYLND